MVSIMLFRCCVLVGVGLLVQHIMYACMCIWVIIWCKCTWDLSAVVCIKGKTGVRAVARNSHLLL